MQDIDDERCLRSSIALQIPLKPCSAFPGTLSSFLDEPFEFLSLFLGKDASYFPPRAFPSNPLDDF
jgi:hypothetical protein